MSDISGGGGLLAGTTYVLVLPEFRNFGSQMQAGVRSATSQASAELERGIQEGTNRAGAHIRTLGTSMMSLGGQAGPVGAIFTELGDKIGLGFERAASSAESSRHRIGAALSGIGLGAVAVGTVLEHFSGPLEKSMSDAEVAIRNTGREVDDFKPKFDSAAESAAKFGFTTADTNEALAKLTVSTKSPDEALKELNFTETLATAKHESLAAAADQVGKMHAGSFKILKEFGISVAGVAVTAGQAEAAEKSLASATQALGDAQQRLGDFEERLAERRAASAKAAAEKVTGAEETLASAAESGAQRVASAEESAASATQAAAETRQSVLDAEAQSESDWAAHVEEVNQRVLDAEQNLSDQRISLAQATADAIRSANAQVESAQQSVLDAENRLADFNELQGVQSPKVRARIQQQQELRRLEEAVSRAQDRSADVGTNSAEAVAKARAAETKGIAAAEEQVTKAQKDQNDLVAERVRLTQQEEKGRQSIARADEAAAKAAEGVNTARAEAAKATDKAAEALGKARAEQATAGAETVSERQQEARLTEEVARKTQDVADAQQKVNDTRDAEATNQARFEDAQRQFMEREKGLLEGRAKTWSGHLAELKAKVEDWLATAGEKLAKPLQIAGPFAFLGGMLLRGGKGAAGAAAGAGAGAEAAGGIAEGVGAASGAAGAAEGAAATGAVGAEVAAGGALAPETLGISAAVAAAAVGLTLLYEKNKTFHDFVKSSWKEIAVVIALPMVPILGLGAGLKMLWSDHQGFRDVVLGVWHGINEAMHVGWDVAKAVFGGITAVIRGAWDIVGPIYSLWTSVIREGLKIAFEILRDTVRVAFAVISDVISIAWNLVVKPIFAAQDAFVHDVLAPTFMFLWHEIIEPVWGGISHAIGFAWEKVIQPVWQAMIDFWHNDLEPVFLKIGEVWGSVWDGIRGAVSTVFGDIKKIIGTGIHDVGGVIGAVLHIVANVAGAVGAGETEKALNKFGDDAGHWGEGLLKARGGFVDWQPVGGGFKTDGPRAVVGEGDPSHPEYVIATDPKYRERNLALHRQAARDLGVGMDIGGIIQGGKDLLDDAVSGAEHAVADVAGWVGDIARKGASWVAEHAMPTLPVPSTILGVPPGAYNYIRQSIIDFIKGKDAAQHHGGGGTGSGYGWEAITHYLDMLGQAYQVTSTVRPGDGNSRHAIGMAVDLVGDMPAIAQALMGAQPALFELIHNPGFSVKRGEVVDPGFWGPQTWAEHINHVHASSNTGPEEGPGFPTGGPGDSLAAGGGGDFGQGSPREIGLRMATARGWGDQWDSLDKLWTQESGWDPNAVNPSSGAYGIPQALGHGHPFDLGDVVGQINWGLDYIAGRPDERDPNGAWAHEQQFGWYETGGPLIPKMHEGGLVPGPSGSDVLALLQAGELVTPAGAAPTIDYDRLEAIFTRAVSKVQVVADVGEHSVATLNRVVARS